MMQLPLSISIHLSLSNLSLPYLYDMTAPFSFILVFPYLAYLAYLSFDDVLYKAVMLIYDNF